MLLTHNGCSFNIFVDPTHLTPGVHCSKISRFDRKSSWRGPVFRILITILKPVELTNQPASIAFDGMHFVLGHIEWSFIDVPLGATWIEGTFKVFGFDTPCRFYVSIVQLLQRKRPVVSDSAFVLARPSSREFSFRVREGVTMELIVENFWSNGRGSQQSTDAFVEL
ncbi:hypothetical protein KP509_30G016100 [Ceratopteris richardii]|uniref:Uncharacterized protein n=1 Tax=Ceratopteris richardii TaxID=49495 RepID=A0A8T2R007_CERRI|nr:hypothetical protein KP509_30G016100 [Ceratopteris richardii]